jgi:hypothetical protein
MLSSLATGLTSKRHVHYKKKSPQYSIPIVFSNKDGMVASKALIDNGAMENFMDK